MCYISNTESRTLPQVYKLQFAFELRDALLTGLCRAVETGLTALDLPAELRIVESDPTRQRLSELKAALGNYCDLDAIEAEVRLTL